MLRDLWRLARREAATRRFIIYTQSSGSRFLCNRGRRDFAIRRHNGQGAGPRTAQDHRRGRHSVPAVAGTRILQHHDQTRRDIGMSVS